MESLDLNSFTIGMWLIAILAALMLGVAKGGIGGVAMLALVLFADIMPAKLSVGVVLPLLIAGDVLAVWFFRRHAQLSHVWKLLPPSLVGVGLGWLALDAIPAGTFKPVIGVLILALIGLQIWRSRRSPKTAIAAAVPPATPDLPESGKTPDVPHGFLFSWSMGILAGLATMLANAAGAVMTIYLLSMRLEKREFVGTASVFFFIINISKTPFSAELGILNRDTLLLNAWLVPSVWAGFFLGRYVLSKMNQKVFENWMLAGTAIAAVFLILESWMKVGA